MRATLQVETEYDVALRPAWPAFYGTFGKEIGHGAQANDKRREHDRHRLPPGKKQHGLPVSLVRGESYGLACAVVLHRFALGAHVADHRAHLPHPHSVGDFDFDLIVVDDLRHLADQTAIAHHGVAAP